LYKFRIAMEEFRHDGFAAKFYYADMNTTLISPAVPAATNSLPIPLATIQRAERLLRHALTVQTPTEQRDAARLGGMVDDPAGKAFTLALADEVFRSHVPTVQARRWREIAQQYGVPRYLGWFDRSLLSVGSAVSALAPKIVMPLVAKRLRSESANVILDAQPQRLDVHLERRRADGFRSNLNYLGEAVLGEEEANRRLEAALDFLANQRIDYVSLKITAIFSQVSVLAWEQSRTEIESRLRRVYRAALPARKFVNLDMEEFRDLDLTISALQRVLDEPEFRSLSAGIVLQAYLPDSWPAQQSLVRWAQQRVAGGGADIKIRLVKGANLAMETVEAELHGWYPAPYASKAETDANFRRMLEFGCRPENAAAVRLGVATHNLFDAALALELRERYQTEHRVELEMLEGMANHQARAVRDAAGSLLLYSPVVKDDDFLGAMSYLVRRLDENTAPENFLRAAFSLRPGTKSWDEQRERFERGWADRESVDASSRRTLPAVVAGTATSFENEPDSDWTQSQTRTVLHREISAWESPAIPPLGDLNDVLETARSAQPRWDSLGLELRKAILHAVADVMSQQRFRTIACLQADGKKAVADADGEVSEAIDFARYYAAEYAVPNGLQAEALGVVLVTPPWNFPYAIPAGGVLAALLTGNSVILKPAPETVTTAYLLATQLWEAGVPHDVLQFFPCDDGAIGKSLITDHRVDCVVLTGGWETAKLFQSWRPSLRLFAETSGKNSLIITAQADRELAIKDLVRSAFGHAGQKCSAASLAIVEAEVYDDPAFRRQLRDAAASLFVGPASDLRSIVTPLVQAPGGALYRAMTTLEPGEEWLLQPHQIGDDPCLWSPGVKLGVRPGSWFHKTECFGPILGLMRAASLQEALDWQNATDFGLTAGLHTLSRDEQLWWQDRVQAGNLYINRPITGAIVRRQPFGGWKRSCVGPGAKAGGPNYPHLFTTLRDSDSVVQIQGVENSYVDAWKNEFSCEHDPSALRCEANVFRYRPCRGVVLRVGASDVQTRQRAELAAKITGVPLIVSSVAEETDSQFIARLPSLAASAEFLRIVAPVSDAALTAATLAGLNWIDAPVTANGRTELRFWLREQSLSRTKHRYGLILE
jgi:RHH-type proline utilization regulon transcriptional repressor/proline dehydrogenase/delta 1-pyrroline-5-carboxylate dehydrogenase